MVEVPSAVVATRTLAEAFAHVGHLAHTPAVDTAHPGGAKRLQTQPLSELLLQTLQGSQVVIRENGFGGRDGGGRGGVSCRSRCQGSGVRCGGGCGYGFGPGREVWVLFFLL